MTHNLLKRSSRYCDSAITLPVRDCALASKIVIKRPGRQKEENSIKSGGGTTERGDEYLAFLINGMKGLNKCYCNLYLFL